MVLTLGITVAAVLSLAMAEQSRRREFEAMRLGELVARTQQVEQRWMSASDPEGRRAAVARLLGVQLLGQLPALERSVELEARLAKGLGADAEPIAGVARPATCLPPNAELQGGALGPSLDGRFQLRLECWVISFQSDEGSRLTAAMFAPPVVMPVGGGRYPIYILGLLAASAVLSWIVARFVTLPLKWLSEAAAAFSVSLDAPLAEERGPTEVRAALAAFNIMQSRVREGLLARTQLLAAISHDLQTPLTRMRLRLEHVRDRHLRERLIADVQVMQVLVREGLDLARSHETREDWSVVDIDSLVESIADDAAELGSDVRFVGGCGASVAVRPNALSRAVANLVDNAVKYGGAAEVGCRAREDAVLIYVRDHGPGLADPADPKWFEPFYRGEGATSDKPKGSGVGLTIARAQAEISGGSISLQNHPDGGLLATVILPQPGSRVAGGRSPPSAA